MSSAENVGSEHDLLHSCGSIMFQGVVEQIGWMFYYIKPNSSIFMNVDDVPNYEVQIFPIFGLLIFIEQIIRFCQKKRFSRLSDVGKHNCNELNCKY